MLSEYVCITTTKKRALKPRFVAAFLENAATAFPLSRIFYERGSKERLEPRFSQVKLRFSQVKLRPRFFFFFFQLLRELRLKNAASKMLLIYFTMSGVAFSKNAAPPLVL